MRRSWVLLVLVLIFCGTAKAEEIELKSGDVLKGEVIERTEEKVVVDHPVLGIIEVPAGEVKVRELRPPRWRSRIEAGVSGSEGNTRTLDLRLAYAGDKETTFRRSKLDAVFRLTQTEGERSREDATVLGRREWLLTESPWFFFGQGRFDYDRFQDYDSRLAANAGVGYSHIETDSLSVRTRYGLGAYREFGSDDTRINPEALIGGEVRWAVWGQRFSLEADFFPELGDDTGEFRAIAMASWLVGLNGLNGIDLKLGAENEYRSQVEGDVQRNDFRYYIALTYAF